MPDVNENLIRKIPPHSEEMENAVLGILLGENSEEAAEFAMNQLVPTDFYKKLNAQIFDAMSKLFRQRNAINVLTTLDKLMESETVVSEDEVKDYLNRLYLTAPMSTDIKVYVQSVRDKSTLRTLIATCDKISNDIYMGGREASDIFDQAESDLSTFLQNRRGVEEFEDISTIIVRIFVSIGDTMSQKG
jgi:replicative DNA helicase